MLEINMDDVIAVIQSVQSGLIVIAAFLLLAVVLTVAVNRKTVADQSVRKLTHSTSWIIAGVAAVISVTMMLTGL